MDKGWHCKASYKWPQKQMWGNSNLTTISQLRLQCKMTISKTTNTKIFTGQQIPGLEQAHEVCGRVKLTLLNQWGINIKSIKNKIK